jgi:hypothetical protein
VPITATRSIGIQLTVDRNYNQSFTAAQNTSSPGQIDLVTWSAGFNLLTPPTGGSTPKALTIIPPVGNTQSMTLKGVTGDTGVLLHLTDPTTISLGSPTATFGITAGGIITGVGLIWT